MQNSNDGLIYFRHGETDLNARGFFQGLLDSPLTEFGRSQAIEARTKIANINFYAAYCSETIRAE
ncbi:histidine phosphatase family protein [Pelagibaculum spongiae]|uniref:Histidine phosphatase family protein n=1 Tax=Pelagibaculum spongiae TaxID=2080658 RepID=A0A2V1H0Q5_9GAMM|nr:hypothetical protein DC094_02750 [Pelagibaculum spongiae]